MYKVKVGEKIYEFSEAEMSSLDMKISPDGSYHIIDQQQSLYAQAESSSAKSIAVHLNGKTHHAQIMDKVDQMVEEMGLTISNKKVSGDITAPMPGLILDIAVKAGDTVAEGDTLLILEAMKMENVIKAEAEATVTNVLLAVGDTVEKNQLIIEMEPNA